MRATVVGLIVLFCRKIELDIGKMIALKIIFENNWISLKKTISLWFHFHFKFRLTTLCWCFLKKTFQPLIISTVLPTELTRTAPATTKVHTTVHRTGTRNLFLISGYFSNSL